MRSIGPGFYYTYTECAKYWAMSTFLRSVLFFTSLDHHFTIIPCELRTNTNENYYVFSIVSNTFCAMRLETIYYYNIIRPVNMCYVFTSVLFSFVITLISCIPNRWPIRFIGHTSTICVPIQYIHCDHIILLSCYHSRGTAPGLTITRYIPPVRILYVEYTYVLLQYMYIIFEIPLLIVRLKCEDFVESFMVVVIIKHNIYLVFFFCLESSKNKKNALARLFYTYVNFFPSRFGIEIITYYYNKIHYVMLYLLHFIRHIPQLDKMSDVFSVKGSN